jgi:hypothetical protein
MSIAAAASTFKGDVARGFGNAKIDRINEWNSQKGDDVEQQMPLALRAAHDDRTLGDESAVDGDVRNRCRAYPEPARCRAPLLRLS